MQKSTITIDVTLDNNKIPEKIQWRAGSNQGEDANQDAKALLLAFWDGADKTALRIDLWTKDMMVDEMADFFYQTLTAMADSYSRATKHTEMVTDMKNFAKDFYKKFQELQMRDNKLDQ